MKSLMMSMVLAGSDWVLWALAAASVYAAATIVDRWRLLRDEAAALGRLRAPFLAALADDEGDSIERALKANPGFASRCLTEALAARTRGADAGRETLSAALADERRTLEKRLLWLGTLGNNAPFVGLFGTVLGVIKAFHDLAQSGAGPEVVMSGLSEALVATAVGLLVALPCVFFFNYLQRQAKDLLSEAEALGRRMTVDAAPARRR
jgi:biopolymer transport protein ExbB/TolQ